MKYVYRRKKMRVRLTLRKFIFIQMFDNQAQRKKMKKKRDSSESLTVQARDQNTTN